MMINLRLKIILLMDDNIVDDISPPQGSQLGWDLVIAEERT